MKQLIPFFVLCFASFFSSFYSLAQRPVVRSEKCVVINGTSYEPDFVGLSGGISGIVPKVHLKANNGNTFIAGTSMQTYPSIFLGELDSNNHLLWSKFYKMPYEWNYDAFLKSAQPAGDNGYIIMGQNKGLTDIVNKRHDYAWAMRVNQKGEAIWQRYYGGSGEDEGKYICSVPDGGYIFIGNSTSFDSSLAPARNADTSTHGRVWICRIDESGNPLWSKCFGFPHGNGDMGVIIKPTADGGFICGVNMKSKGYKNHLYHGGSDIWLAKLNSAGSIQWARYYGGSFNELLGDVEETSDGGFVFVGSTNSNDGDVSGLHGYDNKTDGWAVKITKNGEINWQRCIGGYQPDYLADVIQTQDNNIVAIGTVELDSAIVLGPPGSDDVIVSDRRGPNIVLTKISNAGALDWYKIYGGNGWDYGRHVLQTGENDYIISGITWSRDGDIKGNNPGNGMIWVAQLGSSSRIKGTVYYDDNSNGTKDIDEKWVDNLMVTAAKSGYQQSTIVSNGQFKIDVDTGSYVTSLQLTSPYYNVVPKSVATNFTSYFRTDSISFALQPMPGKADLSISIVPVTPVRPGFSVTYHIYYKNIGTTVIAGGQVYFKHDHRLSLTFSSAALAGSNDDTLKWDFAQFKPGEQRIITVEFRAATPPTLTNIDSVRSVAIIYPVEGDITPTNNTTSLTQRVTGSWDPNDKLESHNGKISVMDVSNGDDLNYTIRFQNMGNDTAFNIIVRDTLDENLDWNSLQMVGASHTYNVSIRDGNKIAWEFPNILLPDNKVNEPASHGFISYKIRPKNTLVTNDVIHNTASIYFDYNLPVVTNDMLTTVEEPILLPLRLTSFTGSYFNKKTTLSWTTVDEYGFDRFEVERSFDGRNYRKIGEKRSFGSMNQVMNYQFEDDLKNISERNVYYRLRMVDIDGSITFSKEILVQTDRLQGTTYIYPNPLRDGEGYLFLTAETSVTIQIKIIDVSGRLVASKIVQVSKGINIIPVGTIYTFRTGTYIMNVINGGKLDSIKLIVAE